MVINLFFRALQAEYIKTKASGLKWLCLGAALFIPLLGTIGKMLIPSELLGESPENPWMDFIVGSLNNFAPFFFPLFLVLLIAKLAQFEHKADAWKLIETQPVPKWALYFSKWTIAVILSLLCLLLVIVFSIAGSWILSLTSDLPKYKSSGIDWNKLFILTGKLWIASWGLMAFQYVLSIAISNFVAPFIVGLIATITGSITAALGVFTWWPYSAPSLTVNLFTQAPGHLLPHEKMSITWMVLFLFLGFLLYIYKKIIPAYFKPTKRLVAPLVAVGLFAFLFWFINRPVQYGRYNKTLLSGTIKTGSKIDFVALYNLADDDTLFTIPVANNRFHQVIDKNIATNIYSLRAGNHSLPVYFGKGDSLNIAWTINERNETHNITGNRVAENEFLLSNDRGNDNNMWFLKNQSYQYKPKAYANLVLKEWKKGEDKLDDYKTVNNVKPADDFLQMQKKLLAVQMLDLLDVQYPRVFSVYYPNDTLSYPLSVKKLREAVSTNDSSLLSNNSYITFLGDFYKNKSLHGDSAYFTTISKLPPGKVKDVLVYKNLMTALSQTADSNRRSKLLAQFNPLISNTRLRDLVNQKNTTLQNLQKGRPAPIISAETLNNNQFSLAMLKGRYIVVDVWATWCAPCKKEAPYFNRFAEQYTSESVAFVSLSVDEDKNAWKSESARSNERVLQLWATNSQEELKAYNLEFIPRFMLIDPKGKIISAQLPMPSDPEFEQLLLKEIPYLAGY
ncbi:MAG: redoxin family protein [Bacteroidota bacterium]|nr:redoxin family protein [Bacteroidota bacterium]